MASPARAQVRVVNRRGLHARAAAQFVRTASGFTATIQVAVAHEPEPADARSILELLTLGAAPGTWLELEAGGPDAEAALAALTALVAAGFGEDQEGIAAAPPRPDEIT